jgi:hypothetical protein
VTLSSVSRWEGITFLVFFSLMASGTEVQHIRSLIFILTHSRGFWNIPDKSQVLGGWKGVKNGQFSQVYQGIGISLWFFLLLEEIYISGLSAEWSLGA